MVRCLNLTFHERRTSGPGTDRIQPGTGVLQPRRRREADQPPWRRRDGVRAIGAGGPCRGAVGVRRPERCRPGRRPGRGRRATVRATRRRRRDTGPPGVRGADARHPGAGVRPGLQRGRQLHPVVHSPHALRHPEPAPVRARVPPGMGVVPRLQRRVRRRARRGSRAARRGDPGHGAGLPPDPGPPDARAAPPGPGYRALLAHPVGAAGLFRAAARRRGARGSRRHSRRRPCRIPCGALGRRVPRLLRGRARRRGGPRRADRPACRAHHHGGRPSARRGRGAASRPGGGRRRAGTYGRDQAGRG